MEGQGDAGAKRRFLVPAMIVLSALVLRTALASTMYRHFIDDAYIFGHYADNFAYGRGLVYNTGERVLGYTSPLYMFLLCALKRLFISVDTVTLIGILNTLLLIPVIGGAAALFGRKQVAEYAIPVVLVLYFSYVDASLNGMETTLMLACIMGTLYALYRQRHDLSLIFATAAALVRPEGFLLLFTVLACWPFLAKKRIPYVGLAVSVLMLLAWIIPTYSYFGTVIPQSMVAKSSWRTGVSHAAESAGIGGQLMTAARTHAMLSLGVTEASLVGKKGMALMAACGIASIVFVIGLAVAVRKRTPIMVVAVFYLLFLGMYVVGKPVHIWSWHTIPSSVCFMIVALVGLNSMLSAKSSLVQWVYVGIVGLVCAGSILAGLPSRVTGLNHVASMFEYLADFSKANLPAHSTIFEGDIGILAYRTNMRIVDLGGLVSPEVMPKKEGEFRYFSDLVREQRPELICIESDVRSDKVLDELVVQYRAFRNKNDKAAFFKQYTRIENKDNLFPQWIYMRSDLAQKRKIVYPDPGAYR